MEKDLTILEKINPNNLYILGLDMGLGYHDDFWLDEDGLDRGVSYYFEELIDYGAIGAKHTNLRGNVYYKNVEETFLNEVKKAKELNRDLCILFDTANLADTDGRHICYLAFHKALLECEIKKLIIFCPKEVFPIMSEIGVGMDLTLIPIRGDDYISEFDLYKYLDKNFKKI